MFKSFTNNYSRRAKTISALGLASISFITSNSFYESPNKENLYLDAHATPGGTGDYNDLKDIVIQQGKKITIMERMFQSYNELMVLIRRIEIFINIIFFMFVGIILHITNSIAA